MIWRSLAAWAKVSSNTLRGMVRGRSLSQRSIESSAWPGSSRIASDRSNANIDRPLRATGSEELDRAAKKVIKPMSPRRLPPAKIVRPTSVPRMLAIVCCKKLFMTAGGAGTRAAGTKAARLRITGNPCELFYARPNPSDRCWGLRDRG